MSEKSMGSDNVYVTPDEAALILGVLVGQIHAWSRSGLLEPHYPDGPRPKRLGGKRFLREEILALKELREEQGKGSPKLRIPQIAMRAFVSSRRLERKLEELMNYLGLSVRTLREDEEEVRAFYVSVQEFVQSPGNNTQLEIADWAKKLAGVTDGYLHLIQAVTGDDFAWAMLLELGKTLASQCSPGTNARMYVDHAYRNAQNAAYLYLRSTKGVRAANKMFPKESYALDLVRTFFPRN
jgi:hypothetical protein